MFQDYQLFQFIDFQNVGKDNAKIKEYIDSYLFISYEF